MRTLGEHSVFAGLLTICLTNWYRLWLFFFLPCFEVGGRACVNLNLLYHSLSNMFKRKHAFVASQKVISNYFCESNLHEPIYHSGVGNWGIRVCSPCWSICGDDTSVGHTSCDAENHSWVLMIDVQKWHSQLPYSRNVTLHCIG